MDDAIFLVRQIDRLTFEPVRFEHCLEANGDVVTVVEAISVSQADGKPCTKRCFNQNVRFLLFTRNPLVGKCIKYKC